MTSELSLLGIDGAPGGWAVARGRLISQAGHSPRPVLLALDFCSDLTAIVAELGEQTAVAAIDMPIGLLDDSPRACDIEARKLLGPLRSSVFPAPARVTLEAKDYADACERSRAVLGKALSIQAFNLIDKIVEVDGWLEQPHLRNVLVEAHPELAFMRLNGEALKTAKATGPGRAQRRQLLDDFFGPSAAAVLRDRDVPIADAYDAAVLVATAAHLTNGTERRLIGPNESKSDSAGRPVQIVY